MDAVEMVSQWAVSIDSRFHSAVVWSPAKEPTLSKALSVANRFPITGRSSAPRCMGLMNIR